VYQQNVLLTGGNMKKSKVLFGLLAALLAFGLVLTGCPGDDSGGSKSGDAGLSKVADQAITAGSEAGTVGAPKTAAVTVAPDKADVASGDIIKAHAKAALVFYGTGSTFTTPETGAVAFTKGESTALYIKVTAENGTALHYAVTVTRAPSSIPNGTYEVAAAAVADKIHYESGTKVLTYGVDGTETLVEGDDDVAIALFTNLANGDKVTVAGLAFTEVELVVTSPTSTKINPALAAAPSVKITGATPALAGVSIGDGQTLTVPTGATVESTQLTIKAGGTLTISAGTLTAGTTTTLAAGTYEAAGGDVTLTSAGLLTIPTGATLTNGGDITATGTTLAASSYTATGGNVTLAASGALTIASTLTGSPNI
jgi:hypothetical protein